MFFRHSFLNKAAKSKTYHNSPNKLTRRENILIYCMNYSPEITGVGRYTGQIGEHLGESGVAVTVITSPPHYPEWRVHKSFTNRRYKVEVRRGVKVVRCPLLLRENIRGVWRLIAPLSFALTSAPIAIWQAIRARPSIIICIEPTLFVAPLAITLAKLVGARSVLYVQDLEVDAAFAVGHIAANRWLKYLANSLEHGILVFFDQVITISYRMSGRLCEKGVPTERVSVVRNWVDLDEIHPLARPSLYREKLNYTQDDFVVLYSGSIGAKQGLDVLLDAARRLADQTEIKFVIAGEGPAKNKLMNSASYLGNVRFLSFQPYEQLNEFLNLADLHVLTQMTGTADLVLPSKLGGMLGSGKRVLITTDSDTELADFVGRNVIVSPPGDPEALAIAVLAARAQKIDLFRQGRLALAKTLSKKESLASLCEHIGLAGNAMTSISSWLAFDQGLEKLELRPGEPIESEATNSSPSLMDVLGSDAAAFKSAASDEPA
jgi:colanic acid biosynthesis glycosyl transferase WcaI